MRTFELTEEQKKTLKLFSYYCGSYGAKTATLTVSLAENGSVDWQDDYWYSDSSTRIESYEKYTGWYKGKYGLGGEDFLEEIEKMIGNSISLRHYTWRISSSKKKDD